ISYLHSAILHTYNSPTCSSMRPFTSIPSFFPFNDTATTEIYTLSLHDALPICTGRGSSPCSTPPRSPAPTPPPPRAPVRLRGRPDRKSTRLNSSHLGISYAVFCLKKKKNKIKHHTIMIH